MERRTFMKYSILTGGMLIFPDKTMAWYDDIDEAIKDAKRYGAKVVDFAKSEGKEVYKAAKFCLKLTPYRFVGGLIYDGIEEVLIEPLKEELYSWFREHKIINKSDIRYVDMGEATQKSGRYDPYKASLITLDKDRTSYRTLKNNKIEMELERNHELNKFAKAQQYMKDESATITFNNGRSTIVGNDLTPNDLFNTEYISFGRDQEIHIQKLLDITDNTTFSGLVV